MKLPTLRFKGFSDEWKLVSFKSIFAEVSDKTGDLEKYPLYSLTVQDGVTQKTERYNRDFLVKKKENFKIVKPQYFVYNPMNLTIGALALYKGSKEISVSGYYNVFKNITKYKNQFLEDYLKSSKMLWKYKSIATGSLIEKQRVHFSQFIKISMPLPSIDEANRISDFLELLTKKIQLQQEKIDLLKEQKKGYMQKIFNRELRFKDEDGNEYLEWKDYTLSKIGTTFTGLSGKTKNDFGHGNHYFVTYVNVFNNLFAVEDGIEKVNVLENENQSLVQKGDIFITTSSETPHEVGMASIWTHSAKNLHLNSFCFGYRLYKNENILPEFVAISLRSEYMRKKIILLAQGSTRFNLSKNELMKQTIKVPASIEEQIKIVNFYKMLDMKIFLAQKKFEALHLQKQAFMQQMFI